MAHPDITQPAEATGGRPLPAMPPRPLRPLSGWELLRTGATNTLAICDEQLFDELTVVRRIWGLQTLAFVSDPDDVRRVLIENADNYPRVNTIRRMYEVELGTGSLASEGETWGRHKRVAVPTLDRRAMAPDLPKLIELAEGAADAMAGAVAAGPVDLQRHATAIWAHLLNHVVTGGDPRGLPVIGWLSRVPSKPRLVDLWPKPRWAAALTLPPDRSGQKGALRDSLRAMVAERLVPGYAGSRDLLWRLATGVDRQSGEPLPFEEICDEAANLIAAGDGSIRAITWIWYLLALHPEVEAELHAEIETVLGGRAPTADDLKRFDGARRILDEVMRLYPPIPTIFRQARRADTLGGRRIPRGSFVLVMPWIVHRHRRLWTNPDGFDPDRFRPERSRDRNRLSFIPFGVGPRVCTGATYAVSQMLVIVLALARRYRFTLAADRPVVPSGAISLQPRGGLWMHGKPR